MRRVVFHDLDNLVSIPGRKNGKGKRRGRNRMAFCLVDHEAPCLEVVLKHGGLIAALQVRPAIHIKDVPTLPYRILAKHIAPGAAGFLSCSLIRLLRRGITAFAYYPGRIAPVEKRIAGTRQARQDRPSLNAAWMFGAFCGL